jgi:malate dehydrogenase (oxaloacetate-decarboxylating)
MDPCRALAGDPDQAPILTGRWNTVAVVTDGSSVPGLGDIGPLASLPLVERKARLMERLAGVIALPLALETRAADEAARAISVLSPSFGAVNLEAMGEASSAGIRRRITEAGGVPVFHDAQDGLPILCLAAALNALQVVGKKMADIRMVVAGTETEALAMVDFFRLAGAADVVVCDRTGAIHRGRAGVTNWVKEELALKTNPRQVKGSLSKTLAGADLLIVLSLPGAPPKDLFSSMAPRAVVLNLSDCQLPDPGGDAVVADSGGDGPNELTGSLVFPGLLRGVLNSRATRVDAPMKRAAAMTLATLVPEAELARDFIVPKVSKPNLVAALADSVSAAAAASGASRLL